MPVENWIAQDLDALVAFRHDLYRHPELLYDVGRTAGEVQRALRDAGVDEIVTGLGRTGVVGVIRGSSDTSGRILGLRADMDALPILETSGAAWASTVPGKMHACGHDGHTSMLIGAARQLVRSRSFDGTVVVIFQPAEEGGAGAKAMIDDGLLDRFALSEVYGMHNKPGLAVGEFALCAGPMMASVDEIRIEVLGRGGHAAMPHSTVDPLPVAAALIQAVQGIVSRSLDPMRSGVVSLTSIHGGGAFNVIPESVSLLGTARALDADTRDLIESRLGDAVRGISETFGARVSLDYLRHYPIMVNHVEQTAHAAAAAAVVAGSERVNTAAEPSLGGEDFAFLLDAVPGAMIYTGNGPSAGLHHPAYDFADDAIPWGCSYWTTLVRQRLPLAH